METISLILIIVFSIALLIGILILVSIDTIEPNQYGIVYNTLTKEYNGNEIYNSGRYIIGPFNSFIIFPSNLVYVEFSSNMKAKSGPLSTRTAEGLGLTLHVAFQFQIQKEKLGKLYELANVGYGVTYERIAKDVILKAGSRYNATSYWTERKEISDFMLKELNRSFVNAYADIKGIQLIQIDLPNSYEDSIVATQVEVQKTEMRGFQQETQIIKNSIDILRSSGLMEVKIINATAIADATRIVKLASALSANVSIVAEAEAYENLQKELSMNSTELMKYLMLNSIDINNKANVLVGLQNSILNLGGSRGNSFIQLKRKQFINKK